MLKVLRMLPKENLEKFYSSHAKNENENFLAHV